MLIGNIVDEFLGLVQNLYHCLIIQYDVYISSQMYGRWDAVCMKCRH